LRRSAANCEGTSGPVEDGIRSSPEGGPPQCGYFGFAPGVDFPSGRGGFAFRGLTMAAFAKRLLPVVRRSVVEMTGLPGYFDGEFDFLAEMPPPPPPPGMPNPFTQPFASVFTVLPDQLGLKLDSRRGPVHVLVIDSVERPAAD
jgi:uncharacterized protein (TIGR03435 family)